MSLLLAEREITGEGEEAKKLETNFISAKAFISTKTVHRCLREYYSFKSYCRIATKMKKCLRDEKK